MEKQVFALESFKNIQELIKFIDQKSGAVLLVSGLILTVFLEFSKVLVFNFESFSYASVVTFAFGLTTSASLIYTIYLSIFRILRPRLAMHYYGNEYSLLYFNHLSTMSDKPTMLEEFKKLDDESILKNLTDQIFEVSKVLDTKVAELHNAMNYLFFSVISLMIFIFASRLI